MGAGVYDYKALSHQVELFTGGLHGDCHVVASPTNPRGLDQGLVFTSHCLERNISNMLGLWTEIFDRFVDNICFRIIFLSVCLKMQALGFKSI
ncbi:hypothetical protein DPMN_182246 [Dreissena polymorpha]|uniref:Peptidase M16C associated domain-containing protein n=1 Tax=Dreissena polymorpha TaxID=45954 RepID=A0A9D4DHQ5_DREPO|nr:hypothetical protein DPMN_182246 [Dreissena polymorpha]